MATEDERGFGRRTVLALVALLVVALGAVVVLIARSPSPDLQPEGSTLFRATGGLGERGSRNLGPTRLEGEGTGYFVADVVNRRDEALTLSVPSAEQDRLRSRGIRASVGFVATGEEGLTIEPEEATPAAVIPKRGRGLMIHRIDVIDCRRATGLRLDRLETDVDGRTARAEITLGEDEFELRDYAAEVMPPGERLEFLGC